MNFSSRTISSVSTDLDDEGWVYLTRIPPSPLESAPPAAFPLPITFDRDAAEVQVVMTAIKVQENYSH